MTGRRLPHSSADGQAAVLLVGGLMAVLLGVLALGGIAQGIGRQGDVQRAADLAALAGARAMLAAQSRLFEPATIDGAPNPLHLSKAAYVAVGRTAAQRVARANGARELSVDFPDATSFMPVRIEVRAAGDLRLGGGDGVRVPLTASATAELAPTADGGLDAFASGGGYDGPLAYRQGKPMRPDVAQAFDRMEQAARADGVSLLIVSAFRSDAEQAALWARNPDPRWVARPGTSLHRNGTELDLGPASAYGWLAANARRFGFLKRYAWEPWHFGLIANPRSTPRTARATAAGESPSAGSDRSRLPDFVPARYAPMIARAAQRWNVSGALLAAQLYAESNFNPFAQSSAGAQGIAQFMPGTAEAMGLSNPFDAEQSINAQAHLMRDLLRQFGSVPLALAAYNAGPGRVQDCGCVPPIAETRAYVAKILALMSGAGQPLVAGAGLTVRLVR
jgi:hypothetical protein